MVEIEDIARHPLIIRSHKRIEECWIDKWQLLSNGYGGCDEKCLNSILDCVHLKLFWICHFVRY